MKVLNLCCSSDHRFEGWFASEDDYRSQIERDLIECPMCGDKTVHRLPTAPHVLTSSSRAVSVPHPMKERPAQPRPGTVGEATASRPSTTEGPIDQLTLQSAWLCAVQHVINHTDDVGSRFAEEARRMHYGEADERPIRGQATSDEARALHEEGIEVMALPMPAALKGPVQ
ncbi:MAG: DUF1178 family protein [Burkholderiaceae bacterium]|nr:DUF1178 family protein [Burkholderiaceae bacterium]